MKGTILFLIIMLILGAVLILGLHDTKAGIIVVAGSLLTFFLTSRSRKPDK